MYQDSAAIEGYSTKICLPCKPQHAKKERKNVISKKNWCFYFCC